MNESQQRGIEGVRVLWPYLTFDERYMWVNRFRHLFGDDFALTVKALCPDCENGEKIE